MFKKKSDIFWRHDAKRTRVSRAVFRTLAAISSPIKKIRSQKMFLSMITIAKLFGLRKKSDRKSHQYTGGRLKNVGLFLEYFLEFRMQVKKSTELFLVPP